MRTHYGIAWIMVMTCGCQPLPAGRMSAVQPTSASPRVGAVYLIRGWQDLFSAGVDQLASELAGRQVHAEVYRAAQWQELARTIAARYSRAAEPQPLVLAGFSYGADDAILAARQLEQAGIPVDLLIAIDPVTPQPVPRNVRVCYDYFQSNGIWDIFPWMRGIPLKSDGAGCLVNIDLRRQRRDLLEPHTSHYNIAANPALHRVIIQQVLAVCRPRRTPTN